MCLCLLVHGQCASVHTAGVSLGVTWWMYSCQHITFASEGSLRETDEERFWWWINESRLEFVTNLFLASISNSHELLISPLDFPSLFHAHIHSVIQNRLSFNWHTEHRISGQKHRRLPIAYRTQYNFPIHSAPLRLSFAFPCVYSRLPDSSQRSFTFITGWMNSKCSTFSPQCILSNSLLDPRAELRESSPVFTECSVNPSSGWLLSFRVPGWQCEKGVLSWRHFVKCWQLEKICKSLLLVGISSWVWYH